MALNLLVSNDEGTFDKLSLKAGMSAPIGREKLQPILDKMSESVAEIKNSERPYDLTKGVLKAFEGERLNNIAVVSREKATSMGMSPQIDGALAIHTTNDEIFYNNIYIVKDIVEKSSAKDIASIIASQLMEYYDIPKDRMDHLDHSEFSDNQLVSGQFLHSGSPLFEKALMLDLCQTQLDTGHPIFQLIANEDMEQLKHKFLQDRGVILFSPLEEGSKKFQQMPDFTSNLTDQYLRSAFLLETGMRNEIASRQTAPPQYRDFLKELAQNDSGISDEDNQAINKVIDAFKNGEKEGMNQEELNSAQEIISSQLDTLKLKYMDIARGRHA